MAPRESHETIGPYIGAASGLYVAAFGRTGFGRRPSGFARQPMDHDRAARRAAILAQRTVAVGLGVGHLLERMRLALRLGPERLS